MLSSYKSCYCPSCQTEMHLPLSVRRAEHKAVCHKCDDKFSMQELEYYNDKLSNIVKGYCPNCSKRLEFNIYHRGTDEKIECSVCNEFFYLNEVERPTYLKTNTKNNVVGAIDAEQKLSNFRMYIILSIFVDFFFIFTLLSISERGKVVEYMNSNALGDSQKSSLNNWTLILIILVIIKIFGAVSIFIDYYS